MLNPNIGIDLVQVAVLMQHMLGFSPESKTSQLGLPELRIQRLTGVALVLGTSTRSEEVDFVLVVVASPMPEECLLVALEAGSNRLAEGLLLGEAAVGEMQVGKQFGVVQEAERTVLAE